MLIAPTEHDVSLHGYLRPPTVEEPRAPGVTDTASFQRWFGRSMVVGPQGQPLRVFHGTNQPIDSFKADRMGGATGTVSARQGFFFTDSPEVASDYAQHAGQKVIADLAAHEAKTKRLNRDMARAERARNWDAVDALTIELENHELGAIREGEKGSAVVPAYLSIQNPEVRDFAGGCPSTGEIADLLANARAAGRDGAILHGVNDSPRGPKVATHFVVFSPAQIKSAIGNKGMFDPGSPDICD